MFMAFQDIPGKDGFKIERRSMQPSKFRTREAAQVATAGHSHVVIVKIREV